MARARSIASVPFAVLLLLAESASATPATFRVLVQNCFAGAVAVSADGSSVLTQHYGCSGGSVPLARWRAGASVDVAYGEFVSWGGLSRDGSVVAAGHQVPGQPNRAFRWENGQLTYLGSGALFARDISADASTIVGRSASEAYRHRGGVVTYLGDLPGGASFSEAWGVNADGSIVVGYATSASGDEAFRWAAGAMQGLGDLDGGGFASEAHGISLDGSVVVGSGTTAAGHEAFRWENGAMTGLGMLDGTYQTRARAVSGDGSVIVGEAIAVPHPIYDSESQKVAVIWDATGMHVLQDWLLQQFGLDLPDYDLRAALDVSSDGRTIVGEGFYSPGGGSPQQRIGWMVTIPEPETALLLIVGLLAMAARGRRSC